MVKKVVRLKMPSRWISRDLNASSVQLSLRNRLISKGKVVLKTSFTRTAKKDCRSDNRPRLLPSRRKKKRSIKEWQLHIPRKLRKTCFSADLSEILRKYTNNSRLTTRKKSMKWPWRRSCFLWASCRRVTTRSLTPFNRSGIIYNLARASRKSQRCRLVRETQTTRAMREY